MVRNILREEIGALQNRWLIGAGSLIIGASGFFLTAVTSSSVWGFLQEYGPILGVFGIAAAALGFVFIGRQK